MLKIHLSRDPKVLHLRNPTVRRSQDPKNLYEYTNSFSDSAPPQIDEISAFENDDQLEHEQSWDSDEDLELDHLDGTMRWLSYRLTPDLVDEYMLKLEELGPTPAIESRK